LVDGQLRGVIMPAATTSTGLVLLREWMNCVTSPDFPLLDLVAGNLQDEARTPSEDSPKEDDQDFPLVQSASDENGYSEFTLKTGIKYLGEIRNGLGEGEGELQIPPGWTPKNTRIGEGTVSGQLRQGRLHGKVTIQDFADNSRTELIYRLGVREGAYRTFRRDDQLLSYGFYRKGRKSGLQLRVGTGNNSYYLGQMDEQDRLTGNVVFLYPTLTKAIIGDYKNGQLVQGSYATLTNAFMSDQVGFPELVFDEERRDQLRYDPSTFMRISRSPTQRDEYESETVYVKPSRIPFAGEGLYALRHLDPGDLVCLFNGNKITKSNNRKCIRFGDEEWSDFRLTLDKSTDLDIPEESQNTEHYSATLGHKACHSFWGKNAMFYEFEHPRFGAIMSIIATKHIHKDEEILVSYNYNLGTAPPWYQEQWVEHLVKKGLDGCRILKLREKEEGKSGIQLPDWLFQNIIKGCDQSQL